MTNNHIKSQEISNRRKFGIHLTSKDIFHEYIYPEIKQLLKNYIWIDLYAGEGNLILPILKYIPQEEREAFFFNHIFLFYIRKEMINKCIENAELYGISRKNTKQNIFVRDNLQSFPDFLKKMKFPIYHITNPPYLYIGYIKKHLETQKEFQYFKEKNLGYQDLYQIAMINDLRNGLENLIYIIPSNFLFGASVSNKFRLDFLKYYKILKMIIFEKKIFDFTGTNISIGFFKRKKHPKSEMQEFKGIKIKKSNKVLRKSYILKPKFKYRAGSEFDEFLEEFHAKSPLKVNYYLMKEAVLKNKGFNILKAIDANNYHNNKYKVVNLRINDYLKQKIESNILYIRTVDTGSMDGRVGLSTIKDDFSVHAIYVSANTYRTHPIQIFLEPKISIKDQILLKDYFNFLLENFREKLDSEFLTTYKYSNSDYTRKYLGLTQTRRLIETFPYKNLATHERGILEKAIKHNQFDEVVKFLNSFKE